MSDLSKRMPLAELEKTTEFQLLTPKQRLFVSHYVECGMQDGKYDAIAATRTAYECKKPESARVMSYAMMNNIRIVAALNRHFNTEPLEAFLVQVDRAIRNKKLGVSQLNALKLKGDILGFTTRLPGVGGTALGALPPDVVDAEAEAKKARRKKPGPKPADDAPRGIFD